MATVIVDFEANADDLLDALQGIDTAADRTSRSLDTVSDTSAKTTQNIDGMKFAAQAAGGRIGEMAGRVENCLLYTSPSPRDLSTSRMPSSA